MSREEQLESDSLRAFAVFAEQRNFTTAAAALRISQPALHVKIRKLATALGVELYQRTGRTLILTEAGSRLAAFAEESSRRVGDFLSELVEEAPVVRLAAGRGTLRWVISPALRAITRSGRGVRIITANREAALTSLTSGQADLAVIASDPPPPAPALRSRLIASYPQILVINSSHRLAGRTRLRLRDLRGLDLVVPPAGRPHRQALDRALLDAGVPWQVTAEVDGWDLLVHFAGLGLGATVVNGCVGLPARLRGIPIADLPEVRYWAVWRAPREAMLAGVLGQLGPSR